MLLFAGLAACRRQSDVFPNAPVILISVDTLRADHLPAYGYRGVETPALDALACDSLIFENAISQVPLTLPSHASLFTGLLPFQNGVRDNVGFPLAKDRETLASFLNRQGYATGGAVSAFVLDRSSGIAAGFDLYEDHVEASETGQNIGEVQRPGRTTERLLERWIESRPAGKPLFAFLHLYEPHSPYAPPEPFASRYAAHPYDGEIAAADSIVGDFLRFLKTRGLYDRSILIFLSDHGEGLGDHGEDEHGIFLYREAIRVPLFVKLPGSLRGGARIAGTAALVDVFPTVGRLLGTPIPAGLAGIPLLDAGSGPRPGRRVYSETVYPRFHFGWSDLASLVDGRYHCIQAPRPEFFDWKADPEERKNRAPELPAAFRAMRVELLGMNRPLNTPGVSDPETLKKLASLGYISVSSAGPPAADLPDPKDGIAALSRLKEASRLSGEGRFDQAVSNLRDLVKESPRMLVAREALAHVLRRAGRVAEAFDVLVEADRLTPATAPLLLGLTDLALENADVTRARSYARAAAAVGAPGATELLAKTALAAKDYEEARREVRALLATDDRSRAAWLLSASIEKEAGNVPAAWAALEQVGRLGAEGPERPLENYQFLRGDLLARMGRDADAETAFREETRAFPNNPRGWTGLALLRASQGKAAEARALIEGMLARSREPASYFAAAHAYEVLGDKKRAEQVRSAAGTLFPGAREARSSGS